MIIVTLLSGTRLPFSNWNGPGRQKAQRHVNFHLSYLSKLYKHLNYENAESDAHDHPNAAFVRGFYKSYIAPF